MILQSWICVHGLGEWIKVSILIWRNDKTFEWFDHQHINTHGKQVDDGLVIWSVFLKMLLCNALSLSIILPTSLLDGRKRKDVDVTVTVTDDGGGSWSEIPVVVMMIQTADILQTWARVCGLTIMCLTDDRVSKNTFIK